MAIRNTKAFFQKFPITNYNGKNCIDLMKRVKLSSDVKKFLSVFYTHEMKNDENIDELAHNYYDDVEYDWLIYLANDIFDPYYGAPLSTQDFDRFIKKKYGTLRQAHRKIKHYKNNYESDDTILSSEGYHALSPTYNVGEQEDPDSVGNPKKYWEPVFNTTGVMGYARAKENLIYNTNKIMSLDFTEASSVSFTIGDIIERGEVASGEIVFANTTVCNVKNIIGDFSSETDYTITNDAGITATVNAASVSTNRQVIPAVEVVYYKAISYYDYEFELNENKKKIFLVDKANSKTLSNQLTDLLR